MSSRITCTYQSLPPVVYQKVQPGLLAQLPLNDLQWKTASSRGAIGREISSLDLELRDIQSVSPDDDRRAPVQVTQGPLSGLMEKPYLHLLFVACEDTEMYRTTVRQQVKDWLDGVALRRSPEWLIVAVSSPDLAAVSGANNAAAAAANSKFYTRKSSVIDKMRADFNVGKKDRIISLSLPDDAALSDASVWAELMGKIKESVVTTFDASVTAYEDDIRKMDSQRSLPGWNFCTFFIQKESLALTFEAMNLLEDALVQYDELEASFYASMYESNTAWYGKRGGTDPGDDAISIFASPTKKPYRDLIRANDITVFDFRCYLFGRQGTLLGRLGLVTDLARRSISFIGNIVHMLRQQAVMVGPHFIESWTYGTAMEIVEQCDRYNRRLSLNASKTGYLALKGGLLDLARQQLEKIGLSSAYLARRPPFETSLDEPVSDLQFAAADSPTAPKLERSVTRVGPSRSDIVGAISDVAKFDSLYAGVVRKAIEAFMACGRRRFAVKLHACLAGLDQLRGRVEPAHKTLAALPPHYVEARWTHIEASLIQPVIQLQTDLDLVNDRLLSTLSLLRAGMEAGAERWTLESVEPASLLQDVATLSKRLEKDFAAIAFPTFRVAVTAEHGEAPEDADGGVIAVDVYNFLPCDVAIDEVRLKLSGKTSEHVWFISTAAVLKPGLNAIRAQCSTSVSGAYIVELSQVRIARMIFQYKAAATQAAPMSVYFARDVQALSVSLEAPPQVVLGEPKEAILVLSTGRNALTRATVRVRQAQSSVVFDLSKARLIDGQFVLKPSAEALELGQSQRGAMIKIAVPYTTSSSASAIDVHVEVDYRSTAKRKHALRSLIPLPIALPLIVNVQDYFRPDRLLSKFIVSATAEPLRIASVQTSEHPAVNSISARRPDAAPVVVLPDTPASFLFKLERKSGQSLTATDRLRLNIRYRSVWQEALALLTEVIDVALGKHELSRLSPVARQIAAHLLPPATDLSLYAMTGTLSRSSPEPSVWAEIARRYCRTGEEARRLADALVEAAGMSLPSPDHLPWYTVTIPLDLPAVQVLATARLQLLQPGQHQVGTALEARLSISVSRAWSGEDAADEVRLLYDIAAVPQDWLISGRKRAEFRGSEHSAELTLIPLRHGDLQVPAIVVQAQPALSDRSRPPVAVDTYHENAAEKVTIVPMLQRSTFAVDPSGGSSLSVGA